MPLVRATARALALAVLTASWFAAFVLAWAAWPTRTRRARLRDAVMHRWARQVVRVLGIRPRVDGAPPTGGGLLVANHLSYVDVLVFAAIRPVSFLAKAEVSRWPVLGWIARVVGVQFVVREDKRNLANVAARLDGEVRRGHLVLVFAEGTSSAGDDVLPFRPAMLAPAAAARMPVAHAAIRYETPAGSPPARESVCWWGDMAFVPHLRALLRLSAIEAKVRFCERAVVGDDRKALARALHAGVQRELSVLHGAHGAGGRKPSASSRSMVRLSLSPRPRL